MVKGSGFRVQGSGFRVQGSGFRGQGSGFRVQGLEFRRERFVTTEVGSLVPGSRFISQSSRVRRFAE
jgi:hypothetical protein